MTREELIRRDFNRNSRILEVGPSYSPIAPKADGWNTTVVDHASQQELVEKYTAMGIADAVRIEPVDFKWQGEALTTLIPPAMHGTFDGLIASHVGEHLPDLIGFLQDACALLKSEGLIALALPDKRVCFDFFQPLTTTGDLLAAHTERRARHQRRTFFNQAAYFVTRKGEGGWGHGENTAPFRLHNSLWQAQRAYDLADESPASDYCDTHAWTFTPKSFELLVLELNLLGHIDWAIRAIEPAPGVEFYVWLERKQITMPEVEVNELRLSLLTAVIRETQDAIAQLGGSSLETSGRHQNSRMVNTSTTPSIAVVVPLFNGLKYVEKAIASVFQQTLLPTEVVVVNDGSTDRSLDIIERLARNHPIKLLHTPNRGQSAARNMGVRESRSDLIAFLDQDDFWYKTHLEELVKPFLTPSDPPIGWVYSNIDEIDQDGQLVCRSFLNTMPAAHPKKQLSDCIRENMFILPSASLISRDAFDACGGFDERLCGYEDDDLFMRIFRSGYDNVYIDRALGQWRIYPASASYTPRFAQSRYIYCQKLMDMFPNDKRLGRFYMRDMIVPRFLHEALGDYEDAVAEGNQEEEAWAQVVRLVQHCGSVPQEVLSHALRRYKLALLKGHNSRIALAWNQLSQLTSNAPETHARLRRTLSLLRYPTISKLAFALRRVGRPVVLWAFGSRRATIN